MPSEHLLRLYWRVNREQCRSVIGSNSRNWCRQRRCRRWWSAVYTMPRKTTPLTVMNAIRLPADHRVLLVSDHVVTCFHSRWSLSLLSGQATPSRRRHFYACIWRHSATPISLTASLLTSSHARYVDGENPYHLKAAIPWTHPQTDTCTCPRCTMHSVHRPTYVARSIARIFWGIKFSIRCSFIIACLLTNDKALILIKYHFIYDTAIRNTCNTKHLLLLCLEEDRK